MTRKRRTRQQKIISDLRRQLMQTEAIPQVSPRNNIVFAPLPPPKTIVSNPYVFSDLLRTAVVSTALVGCELVLFFAMQRFLRW